MGIKLDWQVESEQTQVRATEDPAAQVRRRRRLRRWLMLFTLLALAVAGCAAVIVWRLDQVEDRVRQNLLDTVAVEITALRIGDYTSFMAVQRSASDAFMLEQRQEFVAYQELKQVHRVDLTGKVLDVAIDDKRARVIIEEVIDGLPYKLAWFYWHYEDSGPASQTGWRHVPDDLTFWGEEATLRSEQVTIHYRTLDAALAKALLPRAEDWLVRGCSLLGCTPPPLTIEIVAERPATVGWSSDNAWTLHMSSPLVGRARADIALAPDLESATVDHLAARLVRYAAWDVVPVAHSDAAWLSAELARWLSARLLEGPGGTLSVEELTFIDPVIASYGADAPRLLTGALQAEATLDSVLTAVTGVSLPQLSTDQLNGLSWGGFFQWRLELETRLLVEPDSHGLFLQLYDLETPDAANIANLRLQDPAYAARPVPQVQAVSIGRDDQGQTYATVDLTRTENGTISSERAIWRLAGGTWKRMS